VSALDPHSCWGLPGLGALPGPGPYPEGPGTYPRDPVCPFGSPGPISTEVWRPSAEVRTYRCTLGTFIFSCHVVLPTLPLWWGQVLLLVRPGGRCTVMAPLYCRKGVPLIQGTDSPLTNSTTHNWVMQHVFNYIGLTRNNAMTRQ
jgi:hypothetical protein